MYKKNILLLGMLCVFKIGFAQKFNLGKVTLAELQEKIHPSDSSAAAAILFKTGKVAFKLNLEGYFSLETVVKTKIKIYKKEGYSFADVEIPYYTGGKSVHVSFDDAATYNIVDGEVTRVKIKNDSKFDEKINEDYSVKKLSFSNVKEGSVIEYSYTMTTPYYSFFPKWYFQYSIPVNNIQYQVNIPQFFNYRLFLKGNEKVDVSPQATVLAPNGKYNESKIFYNATNIKAIKEESYINNIENYISMLEYELASTDFPNTGIKNYSTDWESVAKTIYDLDSFGKEIDKSAYFEDDLEFALKGIVSRDERISAIYNYVKSRMNWNNKYGYLTDLGVKKAYAEKVGNVADINLMLVAMLRKYQVQSNPILVSTRSNGISSFPNRGAFNYVIAGVELENSVLLLDATSKNALPNIVPIRVLNWKGRIIREDKSSAEIDLMPKSNSKEGVTIIASIDENGKLTGKARNQYMDYNAYLFRENYASLSQNSYLEKIEKKYSGLAIGTYQLTNEIDLAQSVMETFEFTNDNVLEKIGDKMYFSPMLHLAKTINPFKQENRTYPVDFAYPNQEKFNFSITIPDGYAIESLPESIAITMEQNIANFRYAIASTGNLIQLAVTMEVNYSSIPEDYYQGLKKYYKEMVDKQNEKIVLKKL